LTTAEIPTGEKLFHAVKTEFCPIFYVCDDGLGDDSYNDGTNSSAGMTGTTQSP